MSRPSSDPSRRLSNNPFRQDIPGPAPSFALKRSTSSVHSSSSAFEEWVSRNKQLLESSDDDDDLPQRPTFPAQSRTGSDSNVNYGRYGTGIGIGIGIGGIGIGLVSVLVLVLVYCWYWYWYWSSTGIGIGIDIGIGIGIGIGINIGTRSVLVSASVLVSVYYWYWPGTGSVSVWCWSGTGHLSASYWSWHYCGSVLLLPLFCLSCLSCSFCPRCALLLSHHTRAWYQPQMTSRAVPSPRAGVAAPTLMFALLSLCPIVQQSAYPPSTTRHTSSAPSPFLLLTARKMASNNPFASAMNGEYKHHRDPPKPPAANHKSIPPQPPRDKKPAPPPSYAEAAGVAAAAKDYPREKPPSTSSAAASSRPHRSHSDSARRHDKSHRRSGKSSSSKHKSAKKKVEPHKPGNLDTIDKLDVSAFFGGRFHHDGPFDACTPHRNKVGKNAPVLAFPVDGPNSTMKAVGPGVDNNDRMNLAFGNYSEDNNEIVGSRTAPSAARSPAPVPKSNRGSDDPQHALYTPSLNPSVVAFDANVKAPPIHGSTTAGLGSSTFVDGAPAPRGDEYLNAPSGLNRKKSLVQRLRKNSSGEPTARRQSHDSTGEYSRPAAFDDDAAGNSLLRRVKSLKVGRK